MSKVISIIHLGPGNVGRAFLKLLIENKLPLERNYGIDIKITGIFSSQNGIYKKEGIESSAVRKISVGKNLELKKNKAGVIEIIELISQNTKPLILIDTTASDNTTDIILTALKSGSFAVLSNKKPLSSTQQLFDKLYNFKKRLFFETTVGAGLPIISTVKELKETGDDILEINGCFSGTLGFIFTLLQNGLLFSDAVVQAKEKGYTEPDPRDDLSGLDVARKALILARLLGKKISLSDIEIQSLFPEKLKNIPLEDFLKQIGSLDREYKHLISQANNKKYTVKYVAEINKNKINVKLHEIALNSDIGNLDGTDNIISIKTKRYFDNPLVIKGPGAGVEVTAAGVLGDIIKIIRIIKGDTL